VAIFLARRLRWLRARSGFGRQRAHRGNLHSSFGLLDQGLPLRRVQFAERVELVLQLHPHLSELEP